MSMLKVCFNWKVAVGLAALGVGIYLLATNLASAALPILVLAICPISMLLMMLAMNRGEDGRRRESRGIGNGLMPEEQHARLREQQATLADRIRALEQEEPQPTKNGKER